MSAARKQAPASQATGDTQYNVRDAALRGASLAFSKPPLKPKPPANTYTGGNNGALLAATKVGTPPPVKRDWTGGSARSTGSRPTLSPTQGASKSNSSSTLGVPDHHLDRVPSPSNIAARLAAARYSPLRPVAQPASAPAPVLSERDANERDVLPPSGSVGNVLARLEPPKPSPQPRRVRDSLDSNSTARPVAREQHPKPTDDTPIPPTTTLVRMFEQNRPPTPVRSPTEPLTVARSSPPPVRSPKPQRSFKMPSESIDDVPLQRMKTTTPPPVKPKPKHQIELPPPNFHDGADDAAYFTTPKKDPLKSPPIKQKPRQLTTINTSTPPPQPPPSRGSQSRPKSQDISRSTSIRRSLSMSLEPESPVSFKSAKEELEAEEENKEREKPKPAVPPPRRSNTRRLDPAPALSPSQPTVAKPQLTAPLPIRGRQQSQAPAMLRPPDRFSPPRRPASTSGTPSPSVYHNQYQRQSVQKISKHMTGESLSSAIVGAALAASSRNPSPAPRSISIEPLFPPRKQHHHHSPFHRSPSPPKQSPPKTGKLRTTLRKEPSTSSDEDEVERYKKKGTRIMGMRGRKHPNKHHEGTRKRWRDQITERERKRYEGVWAANKGLFLPLPNAAYRAHPEDDPSLDVLSLTVQEIWLRSRLPSHVLEEVWDLVDNRGIGRLTRYEFVVGLWLIDQRLKGRKLPIKVSESVWASARGVGIKVRTIK